MRNLSEPIDRDDLEHEDGLSEITIEMLIDEMMEKEAEVISSKESLQ